ncbi:MAG TPA: hypothetical protein VJL29_13250 [Thermoguttaceae bacterium]|nr:hypothetical protein [Thermoguttaceae bacterium]
MSPDDEAEAKLIAEYERLRRRLHELNVQVEHIDRRLVQIERQLPDRYVFPDDTPGVERPSRRKTRWDDAE